MVSANLYYLYPIANILSYNNAISRLINTHKLAVVQLWTELSFCCGSIFCRLYIYIGTVFFFIGQWDWFVIAFLWSVIPLDSRLQSSTSDVMYTCKQILAFKVRFHAPLSPRRVPSKEISIQVRKVLQYWLTFECDLLMCKEADKRHPKLETTLHCLSEIYLLFSENCRWL